MNEKIVALQKSLIYQMSLGSKELYHSNVWAWLIETNPEFIKAFGFDDSYVSRIKRVGREEGNRDVSIYLDDDANGPVIVIENKLKSIPGVDQLQKYQKDLGNRFHSGILTGIRSPKIVGDNTAGFLAGWSFVDYSSIGHEFERIAKGLLNQLNEQNEEELSTFVNNYSAIMEYCKTIELLNEIVEESVGNETLEPFSPGDKEWRAYDDLGLIDLINKIRAAEFVKFFERDYKDLIKDLPKSCSFDPSHGFHNKKNTIDICFNFGKWENGTNKGIGVQIEGHTFRRFVVFDGNDKEIFEKFVENGWFDGKYDEKKSNKERQIKWEGERPLNSLLTGRYNKYKVGNNKFFVYQYANITDWDFKSIAEMVIHHLEIAKNYLGLFE